MFVCNKNIWRETVLDIYRSGRLSFQRYLCPEFRLQHNLSLLFVLISTSPLSSLFHFWHTSLFFYSHDRNGQYPADGDTNNAIITITLDIHIVWYPQKYGTNHFTNWKDKTIEPRLGVAHLGQTN